MTSMKQWVTEAISSTGWVWGPLVAVYAPRGLSSMYFNKYLRRYARRLVPFLDPFVSIDIVYNYKSSTRDDEFGQSRNNAYKEVEAYLIQECTRDAHAFSAEGTVSGDSFLLSLREGQEVADNFEGVTVWWWSTTTKITIDRCWQDTTCFRLMFPQQHRDLILDEYLPHVRRQGRNIMIGKQGQRLYSNRRSSSPSHPKETSSSWSHIDFVHPTTFDTLAMHPDNKRKIMEDLDNFRRKKDYYRRIGKPWKRGYLLYGPPGTGKSTMIAAMANYLNYDIYDTELTSVSGNSDLRSLLAETTGKSIIVFEDIDCCYDEVTSQRINHERRSTLSRYHNDKKDDDDKSKVTLSGLLNFIDSVWSGQTSERIIVFTTNFPEKLDEALIRSGRMDMLIEMSYCCFEAFQTLAKNYLGVEAHPLFQRVEELLQKVEITPADVAECFLQSQTDFAGSDRGVEVATSIGCLVDELKKRAAEPKKRRLVPFLNPFVTIDIFSNKSSTRGEESNNNAYKEVEAYLTKVCMWDAHAFCAEGTVEGCSNLLLTLREGHEVTDDFRGVTLWWTKSITDDKRDTPFFRLVFPQQHRALILDEYLPHVHQTGRENLFVTIDIVENKTIDNSDFKLNDAFEEVKAYLNSACSRDAFDLYAHGIIRGDNFLFSLRKGEEVADSFSGVTLRWSSLKITTDYVNTTTTGYRLMFPQQHRALILDEYLPYVRRQGHNIMIGKRGQRLYSNKRSRNYERSSPWSHIDFEHPTTFDTLAMHSKNKLKIMEDLDNFRRNKDYYRHIGKPWKRGYLLYGPPGTGKSSMIAAMANYLHYDVYDMELTSVLENSQLRSLLVDIPGKSIIVFEDIDCCFDDVTSQRSNQSTLLRYSNDNHKDDDDKSKVTLSGLLNFIDGVWSAQTGERIIVFTTNFPDKLDQALIRSGRMDMRIEMSYCCFEAFQTLAKNYLGVEAHPLFQRVEELLKVVEITPADVAECFLRSHNDDLGGSSGGVETSMGHLIDELEKKAAQPQPKKRRRRRY